MCYLLELVVRRRELKISGHLSSVCTSLINLHKRLHFNSIRQFVMTGKAKPKKHTAKEIAAKIDAATTNRGGGKAGLEDRTGAEKGGHAKLACPVCRVTAPDVKSMLIHHEARHPKLPFEEDKLINMHSSTDTSTSTPAPVSASASASASASKMKPGIRGSLKK